MNRFLLSKIRYEFRLSQFKKVWRKENSHNFTIPVNIFDSSIVSVGRFTYGELCVKNYGYKNCKLIIGNYCSIAENTEFLTGGEHTISGITTYPYKKYCFGYNDADAVSKGNIIIGDDVWIGERCLILSGVTIGQGAVIGAGSVISKNIPPYSVFAGDRIIKYRFEKSIIDKMNKFDFSDLSKEDFEIIARMKNIDEFLSSDLYVNHIR